ncbi:MAG: ABC transporter permease [Treponema sp.]|jgi:peptide/nickel transport system permease protein|nr:ABC transporter permease [Treponema sp.]
MIRIARYALKALLLFIAVSIVAFTLMKLSPIDPVQAYIGADASVSPEQRARIAERWGIGQSPVVQYLKWFSALWHGDFGTSIIFRQPVIGVIRERAIASLSLMGVSWLFSGLLGFLLGVLAGAYHNKWPDKLVKLWCLTLSSTPTFWLGLVLLILFSIKWGILPLGLSAPAGKLAAEVSLAERIRHIILPALTLSLIGVSSIAMHTRQKLAEVLESDYVLYAVARGEKKWTVIRRHGLRNIALPALTLQFTSFAELFGGSVLAEQVFAYPGLGRTAVRAGIQSDMPLLLGITLFSALFVFAGNSIADVLYHTLNPQIRRPGHD